MNRALRSLALASSSLAVSACTVLLAPAPPAAPIRAIWITRFDYHDAADVERAVADCADLGFDTILFQVRGNGTSFWNSAIEPRAAEIAPGFDPLAVACEAAHRRGLAIHAWVNVMPSWRGATAPDDPSQLYRAHPEWHWYRADGTRQPLAPDFYVSLNPCRDDVRDYLVRVFREIVASHDVDGLHLDYVRFVDDLVPADERDAYPQDPETLAAFRERTRTRPELDVRAWRAFKADAVTRLVDAIRRMVREESAKRGRPLLLSAAVSAAPAGAQDVHQRDVLRWVRERLVDVVFPMNYTPDVALFAARARAWREFAGDFPVATGMMFDEKHDGGVIEDEILLARRESPHACVFAYSALFPRRGEADDRVRQDRRAIVRRQLGSAPAR